MAKKDREVIKKEIEQRGYKIISGLEEYENNRSYLLLECSKGHPWRVSYSNFSQGRNCRTCSYELRNEQKRKNIDEVYKLFESNNYKPLFNKSDYKNNETLLPYICSNHICKGVQHISFANLSNKKGCYYCGLEKSAKSRRLEQKYVFDFLLKNNLSPIDNEVYVNSGTLIKCICFKHPFEIQDISYNAVQQGHIACKYCYTEAYGGENHHTWKGGITPIHNHLRSVLIDWKKESMKNCLYKCVLTNLRFDDIHHLYGFDLILSETLQEIKFNLRETIHDYNDYELKILENKLIEVHKRYPLGVCLVKPLHDLYHKYYFYGKNTPKQFEEFIKRYYSFEFDNLLEDKYKYYNILNNVI